MQPDSNLPPPRPAIPSVAASPLGVPGLPDLTPAPTIARVPGTEPPVAALPSLGLPALPDPDLANAVEVTGVIQFGGTAQAIVRAPLEPSSRYVGVGARLSNGQVLVKRIEMNSGATPVVILEQNGVEVAKPVG
ncbi:MAG: hypothetical protein LRZ84_18665 [Desertifilum sp.]|nr:hypothetical protein [Desertifilum sp.]